MAIWSRKPKQMVLVHSDQGSQCTGGEWQDFLRVHNLSCSMSKRGNCHDNAVAGCTTPRLSWCYGLRGLQGIITSSVFSDNEVHEKYEKNS